MAVFLTKQQLRAMEKRRSDEVDYDVSSHPSSDYPIDSDVLLHMNQIDMARLLGNRLSAMSNLPHFITWARCKNSLKELESINDSDVYHLIRVIHGEAKECELRELASMRLPIRRYMENKVIKIFAQPVEVMEQLIQADSVSIHSVSPVSISLPNVHGDNTVFYLEGVHFKTINQSDFESVIRLKYAQSDSLSYTQVLELEDLTRPIFMTSFSSFSNILRLARSATYS